MALAALGGKQGNGVIAHTRRRGIFRGQHKQLANTGVVERALDLARDHLVIADVDDFAVGMAHDGGDASHIARRRRGRSWQDMIAGRRTSLGNGCGVCRTILRVFEATERSGAGASNEQKQRRDGRRLQAGEVVHDALAENLIPTPGRQGVEGIVEAQVSAGNQIRIWFDKGMRISEDSKRQDLLAFFLALRASDYVPLKLVDLIVRQLSIRGRDNVFVCKFTIHGYVLQAS